MTTDSRKVFTPPHDDFNYTYLRVLATLKAAASKSMCEVELKTKSALGINDLRRALLWLREQGFVTCRSVQVTTGGTYKYLYKLVPGVKIEVTRPEPKNS